MIRNYGAAVGWWRDLQPTSPVGKRGGRGAVARLRRCATVGDAMLEPEAIALFRACEAEGPYDLPAIALTAAVLVHVRTDAPGLSVARQVGPTDLSKPETAKFKPLRFRRLMESAEPDDRLLAFRRLVSLADGTLNVRDLADALLDWSDKRRQRWTYDYWNAGPPVTPSSQPAQPTEPQGPAA